ncbi:MAG: dTDP-4-dehydrorhamnose reductase, partial [Armatimonadetes bacterium]|nr:dTDP-4-dehydrorhamnose reductase [Anaerolineae bacterium]
MRILIIGAAGRLGGRLMHTLAPAHTVIGADAVGDGIAHVDITYFAATRALITQHMPEVVIHTAAWTDVDGCARDPQRAVLVNGFGAQNVAIASAAIGAALVYISSNEVFDGRAGRLYSEYDPPNPINPYGYSKWVGERAVQTLNPRHYIVRTAWLFAHGGKNFIQAMLGAAAAGKPLRVVTDEVANPTYTDDLADAIAALILTGRFGVYHLVNEGACSRYAFARHALDLAGYAIIPITPISRYEWQRPSTPPVYSGLSNHAGTQVGIQVRGWQAAVDA